MPSVAAKREALKLALRDSAFHRRFFGSEDALRRPQIEVCKVFRELVRERVPYTATVMSSRQTMKNETAAQLHVEHLVAYYKRGGTIVRTAPTAHPQLVNSKLRLERFLARDPFINQKRVRPRFGYLVEYGLASVQFLSTSPTANVEGATADIYLDIDEAHKADKGSFEEKFAPMTASKAVPIILWGVAGDTTDLLYEYRAYNEEQGRGYLNFRYPAEYWAEILPDYARHYEERLKKLGENNPWILTQYRLIDTEALGGFLTTAQQELILDSEHDRLDGPRPGYDYVITIDIAGEQEEEVTDDEEKSEGARDATFVIVWEIDRYRMHGDKPECRIVDLHWWVGRRLAEGPSQIPGQQEILRSIVRRWYSRVEGSGGATIVDAAGIGKQVASYIHSREFSVLQYTASDVSVSDDIYHSYAFVDNGAIKLFRNDGSPEWAEFRKQLRKTRREHFGKGRIRLKKPKGAGHIDGMKSLTYLPRGVEKAGSCGYRMERLV